MNYADGVIDNTGILSAGVNFLQKPFTPDQLIAKLTQILNQAESLADRIESRLKTVIG